MKRILALLNAKNFGSGSTNTPTFKSFARKFHAVLILELDKIGAEITQYSVGHFNITGFFRTKEGQCIYFSLPDVRIWQNNTQAYGCLMWRTAKDERDYTGGKNRYTPLHDGMAEAIKNQLYMQENNVSFLIIENGRVTSTGEIKVITR